MYDEGKGMWTKLFEHDVPIIASKSDRTTRVNKMMCLIVLGEVSWTVVSSGDAASLRHPSLGLKMTTVDSETPHSVQCNLQDNYAKYVVNVGLGKRVWCSSPTL